MAHDGIWSMSVLSRSWLFLSWHVYLRQRNVTINASHPPASRNLSPSPKTHPSSLPYFPDCNDLTQLPLRNPTHIHYTLEAAASGAWHHLFCHCHHFPEIQNIRLFWAYILSLRLEVESWEPISLTVKLNKLWQNTVNMEKQIR